MFILIAWMLIGSSIFMASFYLILHLSVTSNEELSLEGKPAVTILMPAYNEAEMIKNSIQSILDIDYNNIKIIVVDDGSEDDTFEKANSFRSDKVKVIRQEKNKGKAAALNKGIEHIETDFAAVVDADSCIDKEVVEESLAKLTSKPELGAVIASIRPMSQNSLIRKLQVVEYRITNFHRSLMEKIDTLDVTPGPFSLYRVSDIKNVGGFDEGNPTEDLEMAWKLRKSGKSIGMVYENRSSSEMPKTFRELYNQRVRWSRGFIYNAIKHKDIFFNKELGWFGRMQVPVNALMPIFALIGMIIMLTGIFQGFYSYLIQVSAVGFTLPSLGSINIFRMFLSMQWSIYLPLVVSFVITASVVNAAYRKSGDRIHKHGGLLLYFFGFFFVKGIFWTSAYIKEVFQTERIWT